MTINVPNGYETFIIGTDVEKIRDYLFVVFKSPQKIPIAIISHSENSINISGVLELDVKKDIENFFSDPVDYEFHLTSDGVSYRGNGTAQPYTRAFFLACVEEFNKQFEKHVISGNCYVMLKIDAETSSA